MTSKVDEKLDELLDIQGEIVEVEKNLPILSNSMHSKQEEQNSDYKYSREVFYGLVERGQDAIEGILDIARESEHPRVYEVAGQLIKTVTDTNRDLIDLQKKAKDGLLVGNCVIYFIFIRLPLVLGGGFFSITPNKYSFNLLVLILNVNLWNTSTAILIDFKTTAFVGFLL